MERSGKTHMKVLALITLLGACWGPSFLFIKLAVAEIPPMTLVACRLTIGGILLWIILRASGYSLGLYRRHSKHFVAMGVVACSLPFFLITFGEVYISSSMAAIVNSTTPIWTALLAHIFVHNEAMSSKKAFGIMLGVSGIVVVFWPHLVGEYFGWEFGALLVLLAAISYAVAMIYSRLFFKDIPSLVGATAQVLCGALMMTLASLMFEQPWNLAVPSATALGGLLGLSCLGTALAFPIYYKIAQMAGAIVLSMSTLLFPVIGVFLGVMVLGEEVGVYAYVGSAMILCSLLLTTLR